MFGDGKKEFTIDYDKLTSYINDSLTIIGIGMLVILIISIWLINWAGSSKNGGSGLSCWKWVGAYLVLSVPVVSLIMLFVWSFGEKSKSDFTFRCWARLNLILLLACALIIGVLVGAILYASGGNYNNFILERT